jgi:hypothetical protein
MNYDLIRSTEFFQEPDFTVTPLVSFIEEGSPYQKKLSSKTPEMNAIEIDINMFKPRLNKTKPAETKTVDDCNRYNLPQKKIKKSKKM